MFWAVYVQQGFSTLLQESYRPSEFSSNPNQTHLNQLMVYMAIVTSPNPVNRSHPSSHPHPSHLLVGEGLTAVWTNADIYGILK